MDRSAVWREANRERYNGAMRRRVARRKALVSRYKRMKGCISCGYREHAVSLDLHHLDPSAKDFSAAHVGTVSKARLRAEIAKCVVMCANCHRALHHA